MVQPARGRRLDIVAERSSALLRRGGSSGASAGLRSAPDTPRCPPPTLRLFSAHSRLPWVTGKAYNAQAEETIINYAYDAAKPARIARRTPEIDRIFLSASRT